MKIGIDARLWNESGVGRYTRNLVNQLEKIDKKNTYTLFFRKNEFEKINLPGENFIKKLADIRWHTIEEQLKFPSIINKANLDLMHFPYFSVPVFYRKPYVVTIHDLILHNFPTGQASTLPFPFYYLKLVGYKFVIKEAAQNAKKIIAVSNATKEEIVKKLNIEKDKIVVTYEGIDWDIAKKSPNTKYELLNTKYFLYVGNAYPHKNLEKLILAFSKLLIQKSDVKLILVGKEDYFYKKLKEKVKKMNFENSIIFFGEASDLELNSLYKNAISLISPSFMEGFGLPVLEALSIGCLVLVSDIPIFREICGESAIYFNPNSIDSITKTLSDVLVSKKEYYKKNIQEGLIISKKFSFEKMAKETLDIYESCFSLR